jgi:hypothetical protein
MVSSTLVGLATRYYFLLESCCLKFAKLCPAYNISETDRIEKHHASVAVSKCYCGNMFVSEAVT